MNLAEEFRTGRSIPVALKSVEKELAALWRASAAEAKEGGGSGAAVTRACLWNLMVTTPGGAPFDKAKRLIDEISPSLPARVLVMAVDREAPAAPIKAWIEANWHSAGGGSRQIGSDEVTLQASGDTVDDLASVVRALVLPDIPVAAIWLGQAPVPGRGLDDELLAAATRVVVDGEGGLAALVATARLVAGSGRQLAEHVELTSLAWLRATAWRQMIASIFDPPVGPGEAYAVSSVRIGCGEAGRATALLLIGWLASRLRWTGGVASGDGGYRFKSPGVDGGVEVKIDVSQPGEDIFSSVELLTATGPYTALRLGRSVVLETPEISRKQPRHIPSDAELWLAALGARGHDPLFRHALRIAATLVG